ncbi:Ankyrin repeat protein [Planctomycetes bacterium Poly30]|uniref:Ankyrin repeat protein n=1 Tax=Saltatorellus ferox TaxID=2528018 RepID=A0A518EMP2_9BACT|nr:Ankyrin repeat protein [Planctomycetes bacterium Poly30]
MVHDIIQALVAGDPSRCMVLLEEDPSAATARDAGGVGLLLLALYHGRRDVADRVRMARADRAPLDPAEAAAVGDVERLLAHLKSNPDAAAMRTSDGFTPLHLASFFGQVAAAEQLIRAGADPCAIAEDPSRVQPLHSAIPGGHTDVVKLLLRAGAEPNARQAGGWTALMAATKRGSTEIIEHLLAAGADPNLAADDGSTAESLV